MDSGSAPASSPAVGDPPGASPRRRPGPARWAWLGAAAQVVFLVVMIAAAFWQGPRYSVLKHTVSDMSAFGAPHAMVPIVVFTVCGAATIVFALRSVWPTLRPGGWRAALGTALLALSVVGLGDLLSSQERLACRMADPGCTAIKQISNAGGSTDNVVTSLGVLLLVVAGFFLAAAMRRTPGWQRWAWPARWAAILVLAFAVADVLTQNAGLGGLFERLVAVTGAVAVGVLAVGILRRGAAREPYRETVRPARMGS
ncbi:DUF998 domain-containing protein [Actinocatenispora sera]|uniref:DUF998 domain-containing protein n=1 Tax=Actinocatenispora sera TaxID=390989 RepID=UPI0033D5333A